MGGRGRVSSGGGGASYGGAGVARRHRQVVVLKILAAAVTFTPLGGQHPALINLVTGSAKSALTWVLVMWDISFSKDWEFFDSFWF